MNIDIRTLSLVLGITNFLQVIAISFQYFMGKTKPYRGIGWWVLGFTSIAIGFVLILLRDVISIKLITILSANALHLLGAIFLYIGIMRFLDKKENRGIVISIFAVFILSYSYYTYVNNDIIVRTVISSVAVATVLFLTSRGLYVNKIHSITASANFACAVFIFHGCFLTFRALVAFTTAPAVSFFTPTKMQTATFLIPLIDEILLTFVLIIMINQRLSAEMRETKEHFELIFDTSPDAALITRLDDGRFININGGFTALTGFTRDEVIGKPILDINLWKNPDDLQKVFNGLREKGICKNMETIVQRKDGSQIIGMMSAKIIDLQGISHIISIMRDITERKRAEEALNTEKQRFQTLSEQAPFGMVMIEQDGTFGYINPKFRELFGYELTDIPDGKTWVRKAYPDPTYRHHVIGIWMKDLEAFKPGQKRPEVFTVTCKDGTEKIINFMPVQLATGEHLMVCENITERKRMEEALMESEARYRLLAENASDIIWTVNMNMQLTYISPSVTRLLGYTVEEAQSRIMQEAFTPASFETAMRAFAEEMALENARQGDPNRSRMLELELTRKDGVVVPVEANFSFLRDAMGKPVGILSIVRDITERKRTEESLKRSGEEAKRLAQESAIVAEIGRIVSSTLNIGEEYERFAEQVQKLISFDRININLIDHEARTATSAYSSGKSVKDRLIGDVFPLEGTATDEVIRTHSGLLLHPEDQVELERWFPGHIPSFQARLRSMMVVPLISKGKVIASLHFGSTKSKFFNDRDLRLAELIGAQIAGTIANAQLFTERERLEERLRRAEKMEALGTLAGGVAHDLNNVLGVLVGYSELLLMEIPEGKPLRKHVSNILQAGQRSAAIIQDLLTLARRGVAVSEVVNLNRVISDYFKTPEFEKLKTYHPQVTFKSDLDKDLMNVKGSSVHLGKTIMNLLSNAAEAISDHGEVTLLTENRYLDKLIAGYDEIREGDYVVLRVSDNGKGISATDIGKIFEPFYTKKVMGRSGTGLGLAVVWGTVKDHDGYIDVQSEEGKGSAFTVYFPVTREERISDHKEVTPESYMGRGESILVVDDVKEQRELATAMLNNLGYRVSAVSSGKEALTYLKTDKADLLVLDMIMDPGMDGLETYQKVLEINPKQKAIIVSGFSETDRVKKAQELGAGAYVRKPYIQEKIGLAIKRELDK